VDSEIGNAAETFRCQKEFMYINQINIPNKIVTISSTPCGVILNVSRLNRDFLSNVSTDGMTQAK